MCMTTLARKLSRLLASAAVAAATSAPTSAGATPPSSARQQTPTYSPWQSDRSTAFVSTVTDAGVVYVRPRVMLGYGAPHWKFVALDAHWIVTNSFTAPYLGWRASLPFLDAMFGARTVYPFNRAILTPAASHTGPELGLDDDEERSTYQAVDLELAAYAPLAHGVAFLDLHPVLVNAPRDVHIYEEVLRAVMQPPMAVGTRGGYLYGFGPDQSLKAGFVLEYVVLPHRPRNVTRGGPVGSLSIDQHWEFLVAFSAVLDSPDSLGIWHGTYAFLGLTHRWAMRL